MSRLTRESAEASALPRGLRRITHTARLHRDFAPAGCAGQAAGSRPGPNTQGLEPIDHALVSLLAAALASLTSALAAMNPMPSRGAPGEALQPVAPV
jgi:hypothetical protein